MDQLQTLAALGISTPTPAYIAGIIIFSVLGYAAYRYGKKAEATTTKWLGIAMMLYAYVTPETWQLYGVGLCLCVAIYVSRQR